MFIYPSKNQIPPKRLIVRMDFWFFGLTFQVWKIQRWVQTNSSWQNKNSSRGMGENISIFLKFVLMFFRETPRVFSIARMDLRGWFFYWIKIRWKNQKSRLNINNLWDFWFFEGHYSVFIIFAGSMLEALWICHKSTPAEMTEMTSNANKKIHPDNGVRKA